MQNVTVICYSECQVLVKYYYRAHRMIALFKVITSSMFSLCFVDVLLSAVYNVDWWLMLSHVVRKIKWFEI